MVQLSLLVLNISKAIYRDLLYQITYLWQSLINTVWVFLLLRYYNIEHFFLTLQREAQVTRSDCSLLFVGFLIVSSLSLLSETGFSQISISFHETLIFHLQKLHLLAKCHTLLYRLYRILLVKSLILPKLTKGQVVILPIHPEKIFRF